MALIATLVTEFITADYLMQGVDDGEPACPPFERFDGKGFDIHTESHLIDSFGFNNVRTIYSSCRPVVMILKCGSSFLCAVSSSHTTQYLYCYLRIPDLFQLGLFSVS